jgi:hypothetical protein
VVAKLALAAAVIAALVAPAAAPAAGPYGMGDFIGLNVQTEINDWSLPKAYPDCITLACNIVRVNWENGGTTLTLPVVDAPKNPALLFLGS